LQLFRERAKGPTATKGEPYVLVGVVYLYMGRSDDAERMLRQALVVEPNVREAHTYLGLLALQQRDLDKAEAEFNTALALDPNSQLAVAELGEVRFRQQRWAEAVDQLTKSKTVNPALLYMLSAAYFQLRKVKEADLTAELAVDYARGDRESIQRVIDLLNQNQQADVARQLASR
jgi:tetratricopeptide (TPR) repeat protein